MTPPTLTVFRQRDDAKRAALLALIAKYAQKNSPPKKQRPA